MIRIAGLFDIHGNLPALDAVLEEIRQAGVDQVVVGGDVVPGPMPRETLRRLLDLDLPVQFIYGNCERAVLAQMSATEPGSTTYWGTVSGRPPCGHTHMQFDRMIGRTRVVNAGSVGMPFGDPGAYWVLLGPDIQLRRTRYDLAKAAERIRGTQHPHARDEAQNVLHPPPEDTMLELFGRAELR